MLQASFTHWLNASGERATSGKRETAFDILELFTLIDRFMAMPALSSIATGMTGHHAWISITDRGFLLHAYFGEDASEDVVDFDFYGPVLPGTERQSYDPYDGRGLSGVMDAATLKEAIRLLDANVSPRDYIKEHAKEVGVVED
jgi:hypothetical protein